MFIFIIIFVVLCVSLYFFKNHVHLNLPSFFKKGFKKNNDDYGVYCFTGKQGSGKTFTLVDTLEKTRKNKIVITNIKSLYDNHKNDNFIYESNFDRIVAFLEKSDNQEKYIIVYDEIFTLLEKGKLNKQSLAFLSQMRKRKLYLYTTAQEWLEINVTFRRYVRYQIECDMKSFPLFNFAFSINVVKDAYQMKWDNLENEYVAPVIQTNIKKCSLKIANSYDTFETIKTQGSMTK